MTTDAYEAARARLDRLIDWWTSEGAQNRNEATTRLHLVDELLLGVLAWPKSQGIAEESYGGTYTDYSLGTPATRLIVEAKREGVYFDLPLGVGPGVMKMSTVLETSPDIEGAVRQAVGYCQERSVPFAAVTNGHQLIAFLASRQDNVPALEGRALVFNSLSAMSESFATLWNNLSAEGVEALTIYSTLGDAEVATPPAKLAARIPDYPGYWTRNRMQTELKIIGDLVLQDIAQAPELEQEFLQNCYSATNTLSEYALVSREILEARYSALTAVETEAVTAPARTEDGISDELQSDVLLASIGRRPLILLGDVGVGKSIFIRHFVRVDAKEVMEKSIVLSINFGGEPALADDLNDYVMERFVEQLRDYEIDVDADKFVRNVYKKDLQNFEQGIHARLKKISPEQYELKEVEFLERKLKTLDRHLEASLRYASRSLGRQIVVFLDNIDQRDFEFQEKVFLIGQSLAEGWPATVFLSLRPETFYRSRNVGSLTAYQPRVFTIAPPEVGRVIEKRLRFCRGLLSDQEAARRLLPAALDHQAELLTTYLRVLERSFATRQELVELVENLSGGNIRSALGFLNTFVGSGHVDTRKILDIAATSGSYTVALHEFVRAILYGDYQHYDPAASPVANVFEISRPDGREHFLLPIILAHVERAGKIGRTEGFVPVEELLALGQSLGFQPAQTEFALRHAADKRLLQRSPLTEDNPARRYRITTVGAYTYKKLMGTFVYLDAVVVDTPIVDDEVAEQIHDCFDIEDRVKRGEMFVGYLDEQWKPLTEDTVAYDWSVVRSQMDGDLTRIRRTIRRREL